MKQRRKIIGWLLTVVLMLTGIIMLELANANTPETIEEIFPDNHLSAMIAENLDMNISDVVSDDDLDLIEVLNFSEDERVLSFQGLERLTNLENIYIDNHELTQIPVELGYLENLRLINVESNQISDLRLLENMPHLHTVRAGDNEEITNLEVLSTLP